MLTLRNSRKFKYGLRFKSIVSISLLIIVISAVLGWWFRRVIIQSLTEKHHEYGLALATDLAYNSSYSVAIEDLDALQELIEGVINKPHIAYVTIFGHDGQILRHITNETGDNAASNEALQEALSASTTIVHHQKGENVCNISAPIGTNIFGEAPLLNHNREMPMPSMTETNANDFHIGTVLLGVSMREIYAKINRIRNRTIAFILAIIIIGIAASVWFIGKIVAPVKETAQMASIIAAGDFSKFIPVKAKSSDEIKELATAFNQMAVDLQRARQELEEYNRTLEQRVKDRTQELEDAYARLRQSEYEIRKSFETLDMIVTGIHGYLYLTNAQTDEIQWANSYLIEQNGDVIGKKCHEVIFGGEYSCTDCARQEVLSTGLPMQKTVEHESADGTSYFFYTWSPIKDEHSNITQILHLVLDITTQKRLEQQLILSEKQAALGVMAGSIGHELNNAVSGLFGYAEMLQMEPDNRERVEKTVEIFMSQSERIALHAKNLLSLSKPTEPKIEPLILEEVLKETTNTLLISGILKRYTILREYAEGLPLIYGDRHLLEQVIRNLEINSAHAMGNHGILTVGTKTSTDDAYVEFYIKDTGCGIPEGKLDKIFEPFFTTKEDGKGTGLGMAIVKRIVEEHGGYIQVDSKVERGTTMTVGLPITQERS